MASLVRRAVDFVCTSSYYRPRFPIIIAPIVWPVVTWMPVCPKFDVRGTVD